MNSSNQKQRKSLVYSEIFPPFHGGSGRWFWEVYRRLEVSDYVVLAGKTDGDVDFDKKSPLYIERFDFNYSSWSHWALTSIKSLTFYWNLFFATRAVVKKHQISNIHCGRCIPEGFIAYLLKKLYKIPYMCYIHGEDIESAAESRAFVWIVSRALKHADLLICNSENSKRLLLAHWNVDAKRVVVVNPGVDTSLFVPKEEDINLKRKLGWEGKTIALTVSRLETRKGHDRMIEAVPTILKSIPNFLYAIVGSGDEYSRLNKLVEDLELEDHVVFIQNISDEDMIGCYQQCDFFILPNRDIGRNIEGFGIVMIEAQACGRAVISGNSGGTPETLINGETGIIVDCTSSENISQAVIKLLVEETANVEKFRKQAREHALQFDWLKVANNIEVACRSLNETERYLK